MIVQTTLDSTETSYCDDIPMQTRDRPLTKYDEFDNMFHILCWECKRCRYITTRFSNTYPLWSSTYDSITCIHCKCVEAIAQWSQLIMVHDRLRYDDCDDRPMQYVEGQGIMPIEKSQ